MLLERKQTEKCFKDMIKKGIGQVKKVKYICSLKWRKHMLAVLAKMKEEEKYQSNLVDDLTIIVDKISQKDFLQSTLTIKPFRPTFETVPLLKKSSSSSTTDSNSYVKLIMSKKKSKQQLATYFSQNTLGKQFQKSQHPFCRIIVGFLFIIEQKYKLISKQKSLQQIQSYLNKDINTLSMFLYQSAQPYISVFKADSIYQIKIFKYQLQKYLQQFVRQHQQICQTIVNILRFYSRNYLESVVQKLPVFTDINTFQIPQEFKIQGCYIRSINALMNFSEACTPSDSLKKLVQFRHCIEDDIDAYYKDVMKEEKYRQITADVQLDIIKFILYKLRSWLPQIYAQLKLLQVAYGDEQIAYKYDDASYIYAQCITAFEALLV